MKVLILEDENLAAENIAAMLKEADRDIEIVGSLRSVESATEWLNRNPHPDLIVSDVQLLDGLCFEIFSRVKLDMPVIFTTAFDQYAIRAFEVHSIDYLLKPIQQSKLEQSLKKLKSRSQPPVKFEEVLSYLKSQQQEYKSRFMVRIGQRILAIPVGNIAYFSSESKLTYIVTSDNKRYPFDLPLDEVDQQLDPKIFFRINRQYIVRFSAIAEIHPYFKGRIKLKLNPDQSEEIVVSSERTPEFKKWLDR